MIKRVSSALCAIIFLLACHGAFAQESKITVWKSAAQGDVLAVRSYLGQKGDPNACDSSKVTLLHMAAGNGSLEVVDALLAAGAQANAKDSYGQTPLHVAALTGHTEAAMRLIASKARVDEKDRAGHTPLHFAAMMGRTETARLLIKQYLCGLRLILNLRFLKLVMQQHKQQYSSSV